MSSIKSNKDNCLLDNSLTSDNKIFIKFLLLLIFSGNCLFSEYSLYVLKDLVLAFNDEIESLSNFLMLLFQY